MLFFFLHCRAHHYSSDGHEVEKRTTTSRHRGESPKPKTKAKHKPNTQNQPTCENATLKLSNVLLQEVVPNKVRRSVQRCSVFQLPAMYLSHISKHFRKGGFLPLRAAFIHLILRICTWVIIHNLFLLHLESTIFGYALRVLL